MNGFFFFVDYMAISDDIGTQNITDEGGSIKNNFPIIDFLSITRQVILNTKRFYIDITSFVNELCVNLSPYKIQI